jgi:hypothetical protein
MSVRLKFLTQDPEEIALATRYWAMDEEGVFLEKVSVLVPFREITQPGLIGRYVRTLCTAVDENQACRKCEGLIMVTSRTEVQKRFQVSARLCEGCSDALRKEELERRRLEEIELQTQLTRRTESMRSASVSYADLTDDQRFILLAIDALIAPRLAHSTFAERDCEALAPWEGKSYLSRLFMAGVICDDPQAAAPGTYYLHGAELRARMSSVEYFLPPDTLLGRGAEALEVITDPHFTDCEAMTSLWLDYAVGEVIRYLVDRCKVYRLELDAEGLEKIQANVRSAMHTYSIRELWFVMWKVVKDAASLANHEYFNRYKAAATIPNKIRKQIELADKQGGIDRYWDRPKDHIAGSLGMAFQALFEIDELTPGKQALASFAQLGVPANTDKPHSVASNFMLGALSKNVPLPAMEQFAELILAGFDPLCALEELAKFDPQTYGAVVL